MKRFTVALVLLALLSVWFVLPSVKASGTPVTSSITVGWVIDPNNSASAVFPTGQPLVMHPQYYEFKQDVLDTIRAEVPSDVRNAWPFHTITVDAEGHKPEEEIRVELDGLLAALNARRSEIALGLGEAEPPDFTLGQLAPLAVQYTTWNDTVKCNHTYPLLLDGVPWSYTDSSIGATVDFFITLSWESRVH